MVVLFYDGFVAAVVVIIVVKLSNQNSDVAQQLEISTRAISKSNIAIR